MPSHAVALGTGAPSRVAPLAAKPQTCRAGPLPRELSLSSPCWIIPEAALRLSPPRRAPVGRTCQVQRHFHLPSPHAASALPLSLSLGAHCRGTPTPEPRHSVLPAALVGQPARLQASVTSPAPCKSPPPLCPEPASEASGPRPASLCHRPHGP